MRLTPRLPAALPPARSPARRLRCLLVCRRLRECLPRRDLATPVPFEDAAALADAARLLARHAPWLEKLTVRADTAAAAPDAAVVEAACRAGHPCKLQLAAAAPAGSRGPAKATCLLQLPALPKLKKLEVSSPAGMFIRWDCRRDERERL